MVMKLSRRKLGKTGLEISNLGLGGFHQCEVDYETVQGLVTEFVSLGGNYIETARSYGRGSSEFKLGKAIKGFRDRLIIGSKTACRDAEGVWRELNETLDALQTDHLDLYFMHNVFTDADLDQTISPGGALEAFMKAKDQRLIKHIAMSSHWPIILLDAMEKVPIEAVLIWGNYLDYCNYPEITGEILPAMRERGIGHLIMKPLADGFLHNSVESAFRYALRENPDCIVSGFNSIDMLKQDAEAVCLGPLNDVANDELLVGAPELGDYICRQCKTCSVLPGDKGALLKKLFELEGKFDRQMNDYKPVAAGTYALRQRLCKWFGNQNRATDEFMRLSGEFTTALLGCTEESNSPCRYGIDIPRKIRIAMEKLSNGHPEAI